MPSSFWDWWSLLLPVTGTNACYRQRLSDESGQRVKAFARDRIESLPYQLDGSVLGYHGDNGYVELGFDSGEGA